MLEMVVISGGVFAPIEIASGGSGSGSGGGIGSQALRSEGHVIASIMEQKDGLKRKVTGVVVIETGSTEICGQIGAAVGNPKAGLAGSANYY